MSSLPWLDRAILILYLSVIFGVGAAFYRRKTNIGEYFVAGRQIPTLVVVIGLAASLMSCISYLGVPSYSFRVDMVPAATLFAAPIAFWVVARMFLPFFFKLELVTSYQYLEWRFGPSVRLVASCLFLTSRFLWLALVSYGAAVALKFTMPVSLPIRVEAALRSAHIDPSIGFWVFALGFIGTAYTMLGGMRAVMWTDLLQFTMLCFGLFSVLAIAVGGTGLSLRAIWHIAEQAGRTKLFDFTFNWKEGTFWAALAGGIFLWLGDFGLDQIAAQRYLSAKSLRQSQKSALLSFLINAPLMLLLYGMGLVLFAYYRTFPNSKLNEAMTQNPDVLVPFFYMDRMPPGLLGLMLATILAATMSCLTAGINSLSASSIVDIYGPYFRPAASSERMVLQGRWITVMWGVALTIGAAYVNNLRAGLMELSWIFLGLSATLNIGIFLTAVLLPHVGTRALWYGVVAGAACSGFAVVLGVHWLWYYVFGALSLIAVAAIAGTITQPPPASTIDGLTFWTRDRPIQAIAKVGT